MRTSNWTAVLFRLLATSSSTHWAHWVSTGRNWTLTTRTAFHWLRSYEDLGSPGKPEWVKERGEFPPPLWGKLARNKRDIRILCCVLFTKYAKNDYKTVRAFCPHDSWKKGYEMFLRHRPHCPIPDEARVVKSGVSVQHWDGCAVGVLVFNFFSCFLFCSGIGRRHAIEYMTLAARNCHIGHSSLMMQSWMQETPWFSAMYPAHAHPEKQRTMDSLEGRDLK